MCVESKSALKSHNLDIFFWNFKSIFGFRGNIANEIMVKCVIYLHNQITNYKELKYLYEYREIYGIESCTVVHIYYNNRQWTQNRLKIECKREGRIEFALRGHEMDFEWYFMINLFVFIDVLGQQSQPEDQSTTLPPSHKL